MIVLIDNENYMIRLCKDTPDIHGFHPSYPNWQNYVKLLNDMDEMVVLSGKEQEQWLDDNNIYYVHVEAKPKESFETFKRRMYRQIEENKEYIETSTSFGKLVFALTKGSMEKGNVSTDNIVEIWRRNYDNKYSLRLDLPDNVSDHTYYLLVKCIKGIFKKSLGTTAAEGITVSELTSPEFNLFTSDALPGMLYRLQILEDLFKNGYVNVDVADEEYPEPKCSNCPYECPCDADPEECPLDKDQEENEHDEDPGEEVMPDPINDVAEEQDTPDEEYPEEEAASEEDCATCTDYSCPDNPHYHDKEEDKEEDEDENCEVHSFEETEDKDGNPVYKVNGKEVSKEDFESEMKDGLITLFKTLAKAFGKGQ